VTSRATEAHEHLAIPLVIVDALDDSAVSFYERFDFHRFRTDPMRLGARLRDLRKNVL
jgi:hypothetical protein